MLAKSGPAKTLMVSSTPSETATCAWSRENAML